MQAWLAAPGVLGNLKDGFRNAKTGLRLAKNEERAIATRELSHVDFLFFRFCFGVFNASAGATATRLVGVGRAKA